MFFGVPLVLQSDYVENNSRITLERTYFQKKVNDINWYYLSSIPSLPLMKYISTIQQENLSQDVLKNAVHLLEKLPESFIEILSPESFYKSKYNTLIIEMEKDFKSITIDIGSKSFGYFIENGAEVVDYKEELQTLTKNLSILNFGILNQSILKNIL